MIIDEIEKINGFPLIKKVDYIPDNLTLWGNKQHHYNDKTLHFFTDDWRFNKVWDNPRKYNKIIKKYKAVITPDFSLYHDLPEPVKIYNTYKNRWLGNYWQSLGLTVIPSVNWSDVRSYSYCFEGIEQESIIAITCNTVRKSDLSYYYFLDGVKEIISYLKPSKILVFGTRLRQNLIDLDKDIFVFYPYKLSYYI